MYEEKKVARLGRYVEPFIGKYRPKISISCKVAALQWVVHTYEQVVSGQ